MNNRNGRLIKKIGNAGTASGNGIANNPSNGTARMAPSKNGNNGNTSLFKTIPVKPNNGRTNRFNNVCGNKIGSNVFPNSKTGSNGNANNGAKKLFNSINGVNARNVTTLANIGSPSTNRGLIRIFRGRITKFNSTLSAPGRNSNSGKMSPNNLKPLIKLPNRMKGINNIAGKLDSNIALPKLSNNGRIDFATGKVIKVGTIKFNKNSGNVSTPETRGRANSPRIFKPVWMIGNNNSVNNAGNNNLPKSLMILSNDTGIPTIPIVNASGNNTGSNGQNIGFNILNNVNNPRPGIATAFNRSTGKLANGKISFKTSAVLNNCRSPDACHNGIKIGSSGQSIGLSNVITLLIIRKSGKPNFPIISGNNLTKPVI